MKRSKLLTLLALMAVVAQFSIAAAILFGDPWAAPVAAPAPIEVSVVAPAVADPIVPLGVTNLDSLTLDNDLVVGDDVSVAGDSTLSGDIAVVDVTASGALSVTGITDLEAATHMNAAVYITGTTTAAGINASGALSVTGNTDLEARLDVNGATAITDTLHIIGDSDVQQLVVTAVSGQTAGTFVVEASDGTDSLTVNDIGVMSDILGVNVGTAVTAGVQISISTAEGLKIVASTPTTSTATCDHGTITADAAYLYFCTTTNAWERVAIASW